MNLWWQTGFYGCDKFSAQRVVTAIADPAVVHLGEEQAISKKTIGSQREHKYNIILFNTDPELVLFSLMHNVYRACQGDVLTESSTFCLVHVLPIDEENVNFERV
jgi:hypothetical protein